MAYDAKIRRAGARALFDLKGGQDDLRNWAGAVLPEFPGHPNTLKSRDNVDLALIGRDHWLVLAELDQEQRLEQALKPTDCGPDISIVKTSDTQCFFDISGPDADQILSIASPLDVHPSVFPDNGVTFTEAFGLKALILRRAGGYWLAVEQSFGDMIEDYLSRAMA